MILAFSEISQNCFCIGKIMDRVYGSRDHGWHSVHGGFMTMGGRHNKERSGRLKVAIGIWRSKMTKENWVGGPNARLG
jgi:hypothetical protein